MSDLGKGIVIFGLVITAIGLAVWSGIGKGWFGQLPGDISVKRENYSFHFPIVTCLVISAVLTIIMWIFRSRGH
ncbi:MAG: DUF2905 domain-containing protein [Verrucomicrobiales bacterium]